MAENAKLMDGEALALRKQIENAAAEWQAGNRVESRAWSEERILEAVREIARSSVSLNDVTHLDTVRAFLGPTDPNEIAKLPALTEAEDEREGSGRYGSTWRLPLTHEARASVGMRLALLGDPRPGVGLRADGLPDIYWCRIEGGEVTIEIRSQPNDMGSEVVDTITRAVPPFWIARYPVTIAQFQAFLTECYRDGTWQLPPGFPMDILANYEPPKHRMRHANHPALTTIWYEAAAFCHWLGARLGGEIRLPTEYEWQLAATAGDAARIYPWGPDWDPKQEPWRANTIESGLNQSTAVGLYPLGASQAGVLDMAGTVWEWCQNGFDNPDDTGFPTTQSRPRVLRGGSWGNSRDSARCAIRGRNSPVNRGFNVGFRVLCLSPIPAP